VGEPSLQRVTGLTLPTRLPPPVDGNRDANIIAFDNLSTTTMATDPNQSTLSAFPDPPNFYTHFTPANLSSLRSHRRAHNLSTSDPIPPDTLPPDSPLHYLLPPPPPPSGNYWSFSEYWQTPEIHPTLESHGIQRLYSSSSSTPPSHVLELRRLSKSLLLSFLELVGLLSVSPEEYAAKTADIQTMLFNMHRLINRYRPHQARETLCLMMEEQLERVRRETEGNRQVVGRVDAALREVEAVAERVREREEGDVPRRRVEVESGERARRRDKVGWGLINEAVA